MREQFEFRLFENEARSILKDGEGEVLANGLVRVVKTERSTALFSKLRTIAMTRTIGRRHFVAAWSCTRRYSRTEISGAEAFLLEIPKVFEPAGEECGTQYDETGACPTCGSGAVQRTALRLRRTRIPKLDIARTIGGEIVVSSRFSSIVHSAELEGLGLCPIEDQTPSGIAAAPAFQLIPQKCNLEVASPPSEFGIDPFDDDPTGKYRCPFGHTLGLNRTSELFVRAASRSRLDLQATSAAVGMRSGLLRPTPLLVVSPRFHTAVVNARLTGFRFEIARLVT